MTIHNFWFGKSVFTNTIFKKSMHWEQMLTHLLTEKVSPLTREAYMSLTPKAKTRAKDCMYVVPCNYDTVKNQCIRSMDKAAFIQLLALDIDDPIIASRLFDSLYLNAFIGEFNYVAYHTISSIPEFPRIRLLVETDGEIPVELYPAATKTLARMLDIPEPNKESQIACQPMFKRHRLKDVAFEPPIYGNTLASRPFTEKDVNEIFLSRETVENANTHSAELCELEYIKPKSEHSIQHAKEALKYISADCDRATWYRIAAGLKHQFGDDGYELFDKWSATAIEPNKYLGPQDTKRQWDYEQASPKGKDPVTMGYILKLAKQKGFEDPLASKGFRKGGRHAFHVPFYPDVIRHLVKAMVYCRAIDRFVDSETGARFSKPALNAQYWTDSFSSADLTKTGQMKQRSGPLVRMSEWLAHYGLRFIEDTIYAPGHPTIVEYRNKEYVNTWYRREYDKSYNSELNTLFTDFFEWLIPDNQERKMLLAFLRFVIEKPSERINWMYVIQSGEGSGKTTIGDMMKTVLGSDNVRSVSSNALQGQFTSWAIGVELNIIEELFIKGDKGEEVYNRIKEYITNPDVTVRAMRKEETMGLNLTKFIAFTNHKASIPLYNLETRRIYYVESPVQTMDDVDKKDPTGQYFGELKRIIVKYPFAVKQWFLQQPYIKEFVPFKAPPKTKSFYRMFDRTRSDHYRVIEIILQQKPKGVYENLVSSKSIWDAYKRGFDEFDGMTFNRNMMPRVLESMGFTNRIGYKIVNGERHKIWYKPITLDPEIAVVQWMERYTGERTVVDAADRFTNKDDNNDDDDIF